jgi:ABC-type sugar transport system ATPase subunit
MSVLEADLVSKSFREGRETIDVLKRVSLTLEPGEVVALEGPSGSGKTTLLSILGCILTATSGRVVVDGQEVDAKKPKLMPQIRKKSIGFVFQQFNLFPALTASENVEYALNIKGTKGKAARNEAKRSSTKWGSAIERPFCLAICRAASSSASPSRAPSSRRPARHPRRRADRQPRLTGGDPDSGAVPRASRRKKRADCSSSRTTRRCATSQTAS